MYNIFFENKLNWYKYHMENCKKWISTRNIIQSELNIDKKYKFKI